MEPTLRSLSLVLPLLAIPAVAQVPPGENAGDMGYAITGLDTIQVVRALDGHAWIQQNLGSESVGESIDDADGYGDYYQWGRWTDGHQMFNSGTTLGSSLVPNNDPSGLGGGIAIFYYGSNPNDWWGVGTINDTWSGTAASVSNGIDPCTSLGAGWQLPSQPDWATMLSAEAITDQAAAFASNLVLCSAGQRDGQTGTMINQGQFGNYWTATATSLYAYNVQLQGGAVLNADEGYRSHGMPVRCINKELHVGIDAVPEQFRVNVHPMPARDLFTVTAQGNLGRLVTIDATGRTVLDTQVQGNTTTIDASAWPVGVYALRVGNGAGTTTLQLVVQR